MSTGGWALPDVAVLLLCAGVVHPLEGWTAAWCSSVWDFPLESAINELMGRAWSCCVCAVYRKHRLPLEVVSTTVQRLKELHTAAQKGLRRSPRKRTGKGADAQGSDDVVSCKQCRVTVHPSKSSSPYLAVLPFLSIPFSPHPLTPCTSTSCPCPPVLLQSAMAWRQGMWALSGCVRDVGKRH